MTALGGPYAHRAGDRAAAQLAYDLPVDFIAAADWVRSELAELRPEARCVTVRSGVDRAQFTGRRAAASGRLRVVIDDRHAADPAASDERAAVARFLARAVAALRRPLGIAAHFRHRDPRVVLRSNDVRFDGRAKVSLQVVRARR